MSAPVLGIRDPGMNKEDKITPSWGSGIDSNATTVHVNVQLS